MDWRYHWRQRGSCSTLSISAEPNINQLPTSHLLPRTHTSPRTGAAPWDEGRGGDGASPAPPAPAPAGTDTPEGSDGLGRGDSPRHPPALPLNPGVGSGFNPQPRSGPHCHGRCWIRDRTPHAFVLPLCSILLASALNLVTILLPFKTGLNRGWDGEGCGGEGPRL